MKRTTKQRDRMCRSPRRDRGVALVAVVVVLLALIAIATPFSLSMRNQLRQAELSTHQALAEKAVSTALGLAELGVSRTEPEHDPTPYHDSEAELSVDLAASAKPFAVDPNDPTGTIWSARVEDEQGKVDINRASLQLLGNLMGAAVLQQSLGDGDTSEIRVDSTLSFPDEGILWIEGEIIYYRNRTEKAFTDLEREFSTSVLESLPAASHEAGTAAIDYRAVLAAVYPYKIRPGSFVGFATPRAIKDVARFGEVSITADELDVLERDLTAYSVVRGPQFGAGARLYRDAQPNPSGTVLRVRGGRALGPGTVVRIRDDDWTRVEYNLVVMNRESGPDRFDLVLQEPPDEALPADETIVEGLLRAPVNINTCSQRVLEALLHGIRFVGMPGLTRETAAQVAERIVEARPIEGERGLAAVLLDLETQGVLDPRQRERELILKNAHYPGDADLAWSTAPFCYTTEGVVTIEAAASQNLPLGREVTRLFAREVVEAHPPGPRLTLLSTQVEFHEQQRLSRTGRFWTTFPNDVLDFDRWNEPPTPIRSYVDWLRFPDSNPQEVGWIRLAPTRTDGYRDQAAVGQDRVIHFDEPKSSGHSQWDAEEQDGWPVSKRGPLPLLVGEHPASLVNNTTGWVQPFAVSGFAIFRGGGSEVTLFDAGEEFGRNQITAIFNGSDLEFRVAHAGEPDPAALDPQQIAMIRYSFDDGLAFEEDVPYHLTFYARGTRPSDLVLLVDGVPRGRRAFQSRLTSNLDAPSTSQGGVNIPGLQDQPDTAVLAVEDGELFPPYGVVRVGEELFEYTARTDTTLVAEPSGTDPFGGRAARGSFGQQHLETETVELYGYAAPILSERVPTGDLELGQGIGTFGVAMVDPDADVFDAIEVDASQFNWPPGVPPPATLVAGHGLTAQAAEIPVVGLQKPVPGSSGGGGSVDFFNQSGGFALLVSSPFPSPTNGQDAEIQPPGALSAEEFGWNRPLPLVGGGFVGMAEVIRYAGFDGQKLTGIVRSGPGFVGETGPWQPKSNLDVGDDAAPVMQFGTQYHAHVAIWDGQIQNASPEASNHDQAQPIFVLPISVGVGSGGANLAAGYPIPEVSGGDAGGQGPFGGGGAAGGGQGGEGPTRPEMVQLGIGFGASVSGVTEWVRYDAIAANQFVRDNPSRLRDVAYLLGRIMTEKFTLKNASPPPADAIADAVNFELIPETADQMEEIAEKAEVEVATISGGMLAHRGVLGTGARSHGQGEPVLPVFRTVRGDIHMGRPGSRDWVTLIDPAGGYESHRINYAYSNAPVEGWGGVACHVAFEEAVQGEFFENYTTLVQPVDIEADTAVEDAATQAAIETRHLVRMVKFPSGELPTSIGEELFLGGRLDGSPSQGDLILDEVEFFSPATPGGVIPDHARYVLSRDFDDESRFYVRRRSMLYNRGEVGGLAIEAVDPVFNLPDDGCVVLIDDELVAVSAIDEESDGEASFEVAVNGRGFLGTPIQLHRRGAAVRDLCFLRVSRLEDGVSPDDNVLLLANDADFDERGVVQVGRELIGYDRKDGGVLFMPQIRDDSGHEVGAWRGSYGTEAGTHDQGALVYQFPARYLDRYRPRCDLPELGFFGVFLPAREAFFSEVSWRSEGERDAVDIVVQARVGGRGSFAEDPRDQPDVFSFDRKSAGDRPMEILRQGDWLELRVFTRYREGAFDPQVFDPDPGDFRGGSNDWKRAPEVQALGVRWIGRPVRVSYEEWR